MNSVDGWFKNMFPSQFFTVAAGQSTVVKFSIEIPYNFNNAVVYRIVAKAGNVSDGEEAHSCCDQPYAGNRNNAFAYERRWNKRF